MRPSFHEIPQEQLVQLNLRVHPGIKRAIAHRATDEGLSREAMLHNLLVYVLGEPGPVQPDRRPLRPAHPS